MNQPMPALSPRRRNGVLWIGLAFLVLAILSNTPDLYATRIPEPILPWISLLLPILGLVFSIVGLTRAFRQSEIYRGKVVGSILTVVSALLVAFSVLFFVQMRAVPESGKAPQVGQKVPDFTLNNTSGQPTSLSALLSNPIDTASGKTPKAVLLVFYRGYW
jgi:hypothetical protein